MVFTHYILNTLRILKGKNPGDTYYDEYLKHYARDGEKFYDQYHFALERVFSHAPKNILEIGVRTGLSICNMLSGYSDYSQVERIVLVDVWNDGFASPEIVQMNLKAMNFPELPVKFIQGDSREVIPRMKKKYDYILVDGDHSKEAALADLENVVPLVADNGVIVFDDISPYGCDLLDVWEKFKANHKDEFTFDEDMAGKGTAIAEKVGDQWK